MPVPTITLDRTLSRAATDFIDDGHFHALLQAPADPIRVRDAVAKSLAKQPLDLAETAALLAADAPDQVEQIFAAARQLKRDVYGNRIVLFAPLYIGNLCVNDCAYCGFKWSNKQAQRRTLGTSELSRQIVAMQNLGHKRLIIVFGEHPRYTPQFMADTVRHIYTVKTPKGEIRRVNINAAPLDHEGYRTVKAAGIGTYQIFQETYHKETYRRMHPVHTVKGDYLWRLDALSRAYEAGCDDVGIGALFGLYDWRFEVLGLVAHALHLQQHFGCGPHTISFPRLRPASGVDLHSPHGVSDDQLKRLIAVLRLAVPYTGLILTAREPADVRRAALSFGVSQIDAGSRIEIGGYTEAGDATSQCIEREQFQLGDVRSLDQVVGELAEQGFIPSFCTACYRVGRTGEQFMEYAIPGFIEKFCTPNALTTVAEFAVDYASPKTRAALDQLIKAELAKLPEGVRKQEIQGRVDAILTTNQRDLYF